VARRQWRRYGSGGTGRGGTNGSESGGAASGGGQHYGNGGAAPTGGVGGNDSGGNARPACGPKGLALLPEAARAPTTHRTLAATPDLLLAAPQASMRAAVPPARADEPPWLVRIFTRGKRLRLFGTESWARTIEGAVGLFARWDCFSDVGSKG